MNAKELTQRERLLNALKKRTVDKIPVVSVTQTGTLELMKATGSYWPRAHRESPHMAALAVAGHAIAGLEAVRLPFGLTAEAATMGCRINYHEENNDFTPNVEKGLASYDDLKVPEPTDGIMGQIMEAVVLSREAVGDNVPIIVGVTGPFTIAGHIRGVNDVLKDLVLDKPLVHKILETSWQVSASFANALSRNEADIIAFIEPLASTIGRDFFGEFVLPYMKKVTEAVKVPTILHTCGYSLPIMDLMVKTGVSALSIDQKVSIANAKDTIGGRCTLVGNVDPVALQNKKPEDIIRDCAQILSMGTDVLAPGCGISPYTPLNNLKAMVEARNNYCKKLQ